jgi:peptide/nickel transport system substrate-binding protein
MKKKTVSILISCLVALLGIGGSLALAAGKEKVIKPQGEVTVISSSSIFDVKKFYDPHTAFSAVATVLKSMIFDSLVTKDAQGAFQPALADSWTIAKDWSSISFKLHRGVKFHNGDPFTAADVKFSIERAMRDDLKFVFGPELKRNISSVEIIDDYNVRVNLKEPYSAFLDRCFEYLAIIPKNYTEKVGDEGFAAKPVGAGPFRVGKFERDVSFDAEAVENHYRKTPFVKMIHFKTVPEASTRLAMLKTGEADLVMLDPTHISIVEKDPNLKIIWSKNTYCITMVFFDLANPEDSPFKNPLVRRATSLAINRKAIADAIGFGALEPWGSFLAPYHPGYDPKRKPDPYNPEEAKKLLAKAGYPNGFETTLTSYHTQKERFEAIQQQLQNVGIRCKLVVPEGGTWAQMFVAGKLHAIGYGSGPWWVGRSHPAVALESHIVGTWGHKLATPEIVKAMDKCDRAIGAKEIAKAAKELDDILLKSMIRVPLWSSHIAYGVRKRVEEYPGVPGLVYPMNFEYLKLK